MQSWVPQVDRKLPVNLPLLGANPQRAEKEAWREGCNPSRGSCSLLSPSVCVCVRSIGRSPSQLKIPANLFSVCLFQARPPFCLLSDAAVEPVLSLLGAAPLGTGSEAQKSIGMGSSLMTLFPFWVFFLTLYLNLRFCLVIEALKAGSQATCGERFWKDKGRAEVEEP